VDGDPTELASFFSQFVLLVLGNVVFIAGVVVVLALAAVGRFSIEEWAHSRQATAELYGFLEERLGGIEDVKPNGAAELVTDRLGVLMARMAERILRARLRGNVVFIIANAISVGGDVLSLGLGAPLFWHGLVSLGTVYLAYHYTGLLYVPIDTLTRQFQGLQRASASVGRVAARGAAESNVQDGAGRHSTRGPSACASRMSPSAISRRRPCCGTSPSRWRRRWACSGGPVAARRRSPGCCSGCTTPTPDGCCWATTTSGWRGSTSSAGG